MEQMGRLAMRVELRPEGPFWVGYYALVGTMEGAVRLGEIGMAGVEDEGRKRAFLSFMRNMVADIIENRCGVRAKFNEPAPAPDHERTGEPPRKGRAQ